MFTEDNLLTSIFSIISITVSIIALVISSISQARVNRINSNVGLYGETVKKYLRLLPTERKNICCIDGKLQDKSKLQNVLNEMRRDLLSMLYTKDKKYFLKMKKYSQDLEDYVIKTDGKEIVSEEVNREITKKLSKVMNLLTKYYSGRLL